ncbi:MAG: ACT domain-containing protein [Candidatus Elarobacter sp.]
MRSPAGEIDLHTLLASIAPRVRRSEYVFCALPKGACVPQGVEPFATVREDEGLTLVVERRAATRAGLAGSGPFRAITLTVHSSLDAVGFTAAVARTLADAAIPANVIAGYHHDHLLVPSARAAEALELLGG